MPHKTMNSDPLALKKMNSVPKIELNLERTNCFYY